MAEVIELREGVDYRVIGRSVNPSHQRGGGRSALSPVAGGNRTRATIRPDIALEHAARTLCERIGARQLWDAGLNDLAREVIRANVPARPISVVDLAVEIGLLPPRRKRVR